MREPTVITAWTGRPDELGFYARIEIEHGIEIGLVLRMLGNVLVTRGRPSGWATFDDEWMFEDVSTALGALDGFVRFGPDYEPTGWRRARGASGVVRRRWACPSCGAVIEYGDDPDGVALPVPACVCSATTLD